MRRHIAFTPIRVAYRIGLKQQAEEKWDYRMKTLWLALIGLAAFCLALFLATCYDMAKRQVEKWLFSIPFALMKWAALRVPAHLQASARQQWRTTLTKIIDEQRHGPISGLLRSLLYSCHLLVFTASATNQLVTTASPPSHRRAGIRSARRAGGPRSRSSTAIIAVLTLLLGAGVTYSLLPRVSMRTVRNIPANSLGIRVVADALTRVGDPYVWGGAGPSYFDSSGLTLWAYNQIGVKLIHYSGDQWHEGMHVPRNELQPGDLVFFNPGISHVAMYIGDDLMVNAPKFGQRVSVQRIPWAYYAGAVRILRTRAEDADGTGNGRSKRSSSYISETYAEDPRLISVV